MNGHDAGNTSFASGETAISRMNAGRLHATWTIPSSVTQLVSADGKLFAALAGRGGVAVYAVPSGRFLRRYSNRELAIAARDAVNALAYDAPRLIVASFSRIVALDVSSGRLVWRVPQGATSLVVAGGRVYTGEGCQAFCGSPASLALDLSTGRVLWRHAGNFGGRPVVANGRVYQAWGEMLGTTRIYDANNGRLLHSTAAFGYLMGDGSGAYFVAGPVPRFTLERVDAAGHIVWRVPLGSAGVTQPALAYGRIFVPSNRYHAGLIAVDARNGQVTWGANLGAVSATAVANHLLFVAHDADTIAVLDTGNGRLLRQIALPRRAGPIDTLLIQGGDVYAAGYAGLTQVSR